MRPGNTALLLIGFQNDYFAPDGVLRDFIEIGDAGDDVLTRTLALVRALAPTPVHLIATPIHFTADYAELRAPVGILAAIRDAGAFQRGTPGADLVEPLRDLGERLLRVPGKRGLNAFVDTDLDGELRARGVTDLVLAGAVTSICIDSTGRAAFDRGYRVHVLADCISGRTAFETRYYCDEVFPLYAQVLSSADLLRAASEDA